jgi:RNA polymerase sigma factor (sigma-70 family)
VPVIVLGATGPVDAAKRRPWIDWIHTAQDQAALVRNFIKWDAQPASVASAQEALLRLWRDAAKWQAGGPGTGGWLRRVVVNLCLDRLRRRRFSSDEAMPERVDDTPLPPQEMDAARLRAATVAAIAALPDRQRAAIVLTYYEEVSNQVAAEMMDMNIKAFESLLLRARSALRTALTPMKEAAQ